MTYRTNHDGISPQKTGAPSDWNDLLPYHRFKPPNTWISYEVVFSYTFPMTPGPSVGVYDCTLMDTIYRTDVAERGFELRDMKVDPIELLDDGGAVIDLDVEKIPYLPDYTLGGLFPGATRAKWLEIHTNAGW